MPVGTSKSDLGGDFLCDFLKDLVEALILIQPEFAVGDIELGEELGAI